MSRMNGLNTAMHCMQWRLGELQRELEKAREAAKKGELLALAHEHVRGGSNLTREEAAAYTRRSEKTLYRMVEAGKATRCGGYGSRVVFSPREVQRIASAQPKEC